MQWIEVLGPLESEVSAQDKDVDYTIIIHAESFSTSPILIDTHWGREAAARIALDILYRAWKERKRFLAEERMEARNMPLHQREHHIKWASRIADDADRLGTLLEEAVRAVIQMPIPVADMQSKMDSFYEIMEIGWSMAIQSLVASGMTPEAAHKAFALRSLREFTQQWRLVPLRRFPYTGSWVRG